MQTRSMGPTIVARTHDSPIRGDDGKKQKKTSAQTISEEKTEEATRKDSPIRDDDGKKPSAVGHEAQASDGDDEKKPSVTCPEAKASGGDDNEQSTAFKRTVASVGDDENEPSTVGHVARARDGNDEDEHHEASAIGGTPLRLGRRIEGWKCSFTKRSFRDSISQIYKRKQNRFVEKPYSPSPKEDESLVVYLNPGDTLSMQPNLIPSPPLTGRIIDFQRNEILMWPKLRIQSFFPTIGTLVLRSRENKEHTEHLVITEDHVIWVKRDPQLSKELLKILLAEEIKEKGSDLCANNYFDASNIPDNDGEVDPEYRRLSELPYARKPNFASEKALGSSFTESGLPCLFCPGRRIISDKNALANSGFWCNLPNNLQDSAKRSLAKHEDSQHDGLCCGANQYFPLSFFLYESGDDDVCGASVLQDMFYNSIKDNPILAGDIKNAVVWNNPVPLQSSIAYLIGFVHGKLRDSKRRISERQGFRNFIKNNASTSEARSWFDAKYRGTEKQKIRTFEKRIVAVFIDLCCEKLDKLNEAFRNFDFKELYRTMRIDFKKLRNIDDDELSSDITIDAMWNGLNLFFVNGLVSEHSFPSFEDIKFNVSLEDASAYFWIDLRTKEEKADHEADLKAKRPKRKGLFDDFIKGVEDEYFQL
jgi:hypothetical protein